MRPFTHAARMHAGTREGTPEEQKSEATQARKQIQQREREKKNKKAGTKQRVGERVCVTQSRMDGHGPPPSP